ncbi:dihydroneopterin aldolase [Rhodoblastus acidophilus]|uniref:Dihydroneopterin aldolase n=1 Tax=Candidatus Rhodoblastus alkanivorans TaxID=2954117 RepID=A0ABS9Z4S2_9HYPH|nr:dihydroneopterin aldolase [Candidatus Rhodoblastus alkanivorans]MCI4677594.1 dihydroneopterin aldolase [Candidatus Rhodoblastus alkanivorans]MCI4682674.1 dihydroneopterin aldolase [Candidatus Rhodoblastus alkanivorans]MDI4639981.1 dihydroneopterin aldolase [Rhodoblastus acidophilus]
MNDLFYGEDHIVVRLDEVCVNVSCGLHPWERHPERPTRLMISVRLYAPLTARCAADQPIIDYDLVRDRIRALENEGHIDLVESVADRIVDSCFHDERVVACRLSIRKPDIYNETRGAGIDLFRTRARWSAAE